jgi:hypothetical protein
MNCQDFEASINDLARDQIMDSAVREGALAHSEGCRECAARLADERMLSAGLSRLAASGDEAPARVEAALLAHFRERKVIQTGQPASGFPVLRARRSRWAIAAAAAILILIALVALRTNQVGTNQSVSEPNEQATGAQSAPVVTPTAPPAPEQISTEPKNPEQKNFAAPPNRKRNLQNHYAADRARRAAPHREESKGKDAAEADYEIATDFIPLTSRGSLAQLEGGHVVRVEMPRSALVSFGLPVNLERAGERIKADVVVGNDGMARAIRFVR